MFTKNEFVQLLIYTLENAAPIVHKDGKKQKLNLSKWFNSI
jgi:hypothetical protein